MIAEKLYQVTLKKVETKKETAKIGVSVDGTLPERLRSYAFKGPAANLGGK